MPSTLVMPSTVIPQDVLRHPGFQAVLDADHTGSYRKDKEAVYVSLIQLFGTSEGLVAYLESVAEGQVQTLGDPPTRFQRILNVRPGVKIGFNYTEIGVFVSGDPQLLVEMSLLTDDHGSYSVVRTHHGLCGLEETIPPSGSLYYVSVGNVFRVKQTVNGQVRYTEQFLVPNPD